MTVLFRGIATMVGILACGVGAWAVALLTFFALPLAADGKYVSMSALKASFAHAKTCWVEILVFALIGGLVIFVGELACLVGVFVAIPIFYVAWWLFYVEHRDAILAAAAEAGVEATV